MKNYSTENIINLALTGHASTGKTMFAEAMLANAGMINKMGSITSGTTVSDYREYEIENQHSISLTLMNLEWKDKKINIDLLKGAILGSFLTVLSFVLFTNNTIEKLDFNPEIFKIYIDLWDGHRNPLGHIHYEYLLKTIFLFLVVNIYFFRDSFYVSISIAVHIKI